MLNKARVALYLRVSTEEQARNGDSLEAQRAALRQYAKTNGYEVIGEYCDDGVSGKKPYHKRPALSRFMEDIKTTPVDILLFCKLDRFYRSVKLYYQAMDIMEKYHVAWRAIQEDYETVTSAGRFKVNIMLSIAEAEADRTSERIKAVFENKVTRGEVITGSVPIGFKIKDKRLVIDEDKCEIAKSMFRHYQKTCSLRSTSRFLYDEFHVIIPRYMVSRMLKNPIYTGRYRDNINYCNPIISASDFDDVQKKLTGRSIRFNPTGNIYIFSGLIICRECLYSMCGIRTGKKPYIYYRCNMAALYRNCTHIKSVRETYIERWLMDNMAEEIKRVEIEWKEKLKSVGRTKPKTNPAAIMRKMERLKDLYVDELITRKQYVADYEKYKKQLEEIRQQEVIPETPAILRCKEIFDDNFENLYDSMSREDKRNFWRGLLAKIEMDSQNNIRLFFK